MYMSCLSGIFLGSVKGNFCISPLNAIENIRNAGGCLSTRGTRNGLGNRPQKGMQFNTSRRN
jgi:hypothetical protein